MENNPQRKTPSAVHAADTVPQIHAIIAARAFHRTVARGENNRLPLVGRDDFRFRLRARLLLDENKFSPVPVTPMLSQQENHLQGKTDLAIKILVQAVITARFVMQDQRGGFCLPRAMANLEKSCVVPGIRGSSIVESFG